MSWHDGYGLIVICVVSHRFRGPRRRSPGRPGARTVPRRPRAGPPAPCVGPVAPAAASRAARIAVHASRLRGAAAWSRHRWTGTPAARLTTSPAMPSAFVIVAASQPQQPAPRQQQRQGFRRPASRAARGRGSRAGSPRRPGRPPRSPRLRRSSSSRPSAPTCSPTASAAGSTAAVACTRPPAWVSSKSRPCTSAPLASAAAGADTVLPVPRMRASGGPPSPVATCDRGADDAGARRRERGAQAVEQVPARGRQHRLGHVVVGQPDRPGRELLGQRRRAHRAHAFGRYGVVSASPNAPESTRAAIRSSS